MTVSSTTLYGREFDTLVFTDVNKANEFMETHNYGVLKVDGDDIHLAKMDDEGREVSQSVECVI